MVGFNSNSYLNNINFKGAITDNDIAGLRSAKQHFSDCYLIGTLETLTQTDNGKKILKENIQRDDDNPEIVNCYLYKKNGEKEKFTIPTTSVLKGYEKVYKKQPNEIVRSINISVNEYEKKYKSKPTLCRILDNFKSYAFEYNLPSNFMKMITGVQPRVIGETDLNLNLTSYKDEVMELFKRMDKEDKHSFIISTGAKALNGHRWHVYVIQDVNLENNTITIKEKRKNKPETMSIDEALKTFKFIAGYFNSDLDKTKEPKS